jgi:hypothetical protein
MGCMYAVTEYAVCAEETLLGLTVEREHAVVLETTKWCVGL